MSRRIKKFFCAKGAAAIRKSPRPKTSRGVRRRSPGVTGFIMLFFAVRDPHKCTASRLRARYFYCSGIPWQIWRDPKLFGAPVAKIFEERDQCPAGAAERVGDLRRRGAQCHPVDDTIFLQFTELRGEHLFADASQKIAKFGEAPRAKRKVPDRLDFPLATQHVDGRLNRAVVVSLHRGLRAYKFVRTSPQHIVVIPCP